MNSLSQIILSLQGKVNEIISTIPLDEWRARISEIDFLSNDPVLWNNPQKAAELMKERQRIFESISKAEKFKEQTNFYSQALQELSSEDLNEFTDQISLLSQEIEDFEFKRLFNDPTDQNPAILTINSGAGGLEAANWTQMLLRMYSRFADQNGFKIEILDEERKAEYSSECLNSVSIRIDGPFAYGFFKSETGVHRLIRISPFDNSGGRHTSLAAVDVIPDIDDSIEIKIEDKDIEITAQRSGGPGGQNSNKVNSCCRIKHFPTGINIAVRTERDFHANKKTALKMLKAKLFDLEKKKQSSIQDQKLANQSDISFGHQIRTYTEDDSRVKCQKTGFEVRDFHKVLNGDLFPFIKVALQSK